MASTTHLAGVGVLVGLWDMSDPRLELALDKSELRRFHDSVDSGAEVPVECQVFADLERAGRVDRVGGTRWGPVMLQKVDDMTNSLVEAAYEGRNHLGDLFGDMRLAGLPFTRWELYSAPFRVEIDPALADVLDGRLP